MNLETKYQPTDNVYIIVGTDDNAKILLSKISSIEIEVSSRLVINIIYNCSVSKHDTETYVNGMPEHFNVVRNEKNMFDTTEMAIEHISNKLKQHK